MLNKLQPLDRARDKILRLQFSLTPNFSWVSETDVAREPFQRFLDSGLFRAERGVLDHVAHFMVIVRDDETVKTVNRLRRHGHPTKVGC